MSLFFSAWNKSGLWDLWPSFRGIINTATHCIQLLWVFLFQSSILKSLQLNFPPLDTLSLKMWNWDWHVDEREGNRAWEKLQWVHCWSNSPEFRKFFLFSSPAAGRIFKSELVLFLTWKENMTQIYEKPILLWSIETEVSILLRESTTRKWAEDTLALLWQNGCTDFLVLFTCSSPSDV